MLSGLKGGDSAPRGRTICSCFSIGERQIGEAIAGGCVSVEALGAKLKCGTNCGSCIPELKALLAANQPDAGLMIGDSKRQPVSVYSWNGPQGCGEGQKTIN
ncbi:hypothetical protein UA44_07445 [Klebsiella aerogenes]|nr:hypothetical protein UA44_07445 [Klebsiella aerogenes]